jgi:hypothetical protein
MAWKRAETRSVYVRRSWIKHTQLCSYWVCLRLCVPGIANTWHTLPKWHAKSICLLHKRFDMAPSVPAEMEDSAKKSSKDIFIAYRCDVGWTDWVFMYICIYVCMYVCVNGSLCKHCAGCHLRCMFLFTVYEKKIWVFLNWPDVLKVTTILSQLWTRGHYMYRQFGGQHMYR